MIHVMHTHPPAAANITC